MTRISNSSKCKQLSSILQWKYLPIASLLICILSMVVMSFSNIETVYEPHLLMPVLNTIFLALIPFVISIVAARSYLFSGLNSLLFMGCGMIAFGCGSIMGAWLINHPSGPNMTVTVHNTGVLVASLFSILSAISTNNKNIPVAIHNTRKPTLILVYAGMLLVMSILAQAAHLGLTPGFFIQGVGPTHIRQLVLGVAVLLYFLSALVYLRMFIDSERKYHYWHCFAMLMIAFGLIAIFVQKNVGSPIGWLGRSGQYIGCIYALVAIRYAFKSARVQGVHLQNALAVLFGNAELSYRTLVETVMDPIISFDQNGTIIQWNTAAEMVFGYQQDEIIGSSLFNLIITEDYTDLFLSRLEKLKSNDEETKITRLVEITGKSKAGNIIRVDVSISAINAQDKWIYICVFRDVSERTQLVAQIVELNEMLEHKVNERTVQLHILNSELEQEIVERKQVEDSLRQSEERLYLILKGSNDAPWDWDPVSHTLYYSPRWWEMVGYDVDELPPDEGHWERLLHPDDKPGFSEFLEKRLADGPDVWEFESRMHHRDGHYVPLLTRGSILRDKDGKPVRVSGTNTDLTQRKQVEAALRESDDRFQHLIVQAPIPLCIVNKDKVITYINNRFVELFGYTPEEIPTMNEWWKLAYPDETYRLQVKEIWKTAIERATRDNIDIEPIEFNVSCKDGSVRIVLISGIAFYPDFLAVITDITERKRAEDALRDSEKRLREVTENSIDASYKRDLKTNTYEYLSPVFTQITGYTLDEFCDLPTELVMNLIHPDDRAKIESVITETMSGVEGTPYQVEYRFKHKDGHYRWLHDQFIVIRNEQRQSDAFIGNISDITERKQVEEELERLSERDHHIAEVLQQIVMPPAIPMLPESYEIATKYQPASHEADVCGDFCDIFDLSNGKIGISVGDIVGKGLLAAIRVTAAKNMIRNYAYLYDQPSKVMSLVNNALCRDIAMENDMLTAFFAVLDTHDNSLTYSNAGHEPPILLQVDGQAKPMKSGGPMFCGIGKQTYTEGCISLKPGDIFVAVTDGITEASIDRHSEQFAADGIVNSLSTHTDDSAEQIAAVILSDATRFANGALVDDATIVVIKNV